MRSPGPAPFTPSARGCSANTPRKSASTAPSPSTTARTPPISSISFRHDLGFSRSERRFPAKGTCLAIYSRVVNAQAPLDEVLGTCLSLVRRLGSRAAPALFRLCRGQAAPARARLRRPAALLGADDGGAGCSPPRSASASITCWSTNTRTPTACRPRSCWRSSRGQRPHRGRRRRPVDLLVPRRDRAQHPRFSRPLPPARRDRHARAQLPLDASPSSRPPTP